MPRDLAFVSDESADPHHAYGNRPQDGSNKHGGIKWMPDQRSPIHGDEGEQGVLVRKSGEALGRVSFEETQRPNDRR